MPQMTMQNHNDVMDASTFDRFRKLIYDKSGISLGTNKEALVKSRISKRMRVLGIGTYRDYLSFVLDDQSGGEMELLLDAISTNVTSFYREPGHFVFMREVIKGWLSKGAHSLRVWSAACSSGEEPYTIAMELLETLKGNIDAKILATDIAPSVLGRCMKGEYSPESVAPIPKHVLTKYFSKKKVNGEIVFVAGDRIRNLVLFRQTNLSKFPYPLRGPLDIVFCRNVMIYFDRQTKAKIVGEAQRLLKPGGYLIIGNAESLAGIAPGFDSIKPAIYKRR